MFRSFPGASSINTCLDCQERHPACHDHCDKYQAAKEKRSEEIQKIRENKRLSLELYHHKIEKMRQENKKRKY